MPLLWACGVSVCQPGCGDAHADKADDRTSRDVLEGDHRTDRMTTQASDLRNHRFANWREQARRIRTVQASAWRHTSRRCNPSRQCGAETRGCLGLEKYLVDSSHPLYFFGLMADKENVAAKRDRARFRLSSKPCPIARLLDASNGDTFLPPSLW